jgi:hypothetical protein
MRCRCAAGIFHRSAVFQPPHLGFAAFGHLFPRIRWNSESQRRQGHQPYPQRFPNLDSSRYGVGISPNFITASSTRSSQTKRGDHARTTPRYATRSMHTLAVQRTESRWIEIPHSLLYELLSGRGGYVVCRTYRCLLVPSKQQTQLPRHHLL